MALLNKDAILGADDRKSEDVDVPEWGGTVRLVGLSGAERDAYEASLVVLGPKGNAIGRNFVNMRARLVAKCLVDEDGDRLFTDSEIKDLGTKSGAVIDRLFDKAKAMSGINDDAVAVKAGNSGAAPSGGSISDSPATSA